MSKKPAEKVILLKSITGPFAEDKDAAAFLRDEKIRPAIVAGGRITLDFNGVRVATQSFVHALISDVLRQSGEAVLNRITFKRCSQAVRGIIETVVQYSLESLESESDERETNGQQKTEKEPPRKKRGAK